MIPIDIDRILSRPGEFFGRTIAVRGASSYLYRTSVFLHDDPSRAGAVAGRIVVSPCDFDAVRHLLPLHTGATPDDVPIPAHS